MGYGSMNNAQRHLAALYDDAKRRVGRSLTIYNEVSDMLDKLDRKEHCPDYDALCDQLRQIA